MSGVCVCVCVRTRVMHDTQSDVCMYLRLQNTWAVLPTRTPTLRSDTCQGVIGGKVCDTHTRTHTSASEDCSTP